MSDPEEKIKKKQAKSALKAAKKSGPRQSGGRSAFLDGVGVSIRRKDGGSELVVTGLSDQQLGRLVPQVNKEVLIAVTAERSALRAGLMRFVREGAFQTLIKITAGLIVGYLLIQFGLG